MCSPEIYYWNIQKIPATYSKTHETLETAFEYTCIVIVTCATRDLLYFATLDEIFATYV
jgi:hypothetical protein